MKNEKLLGLFFLNLIFGLATCHAQEESPSWVNFAQKAKTGKLNEANLSDYSYTGYHFSEKKIPDVSTWNTINVLDYGAIAGDEGYDDVAIKAAIAAAESNPLPTVVYFPVGRYKVSSTETENSPIFIRGSHIVLKGAGAGIGGTEIFTDKRGADDKDHPYRFEFKPASVPATKITNTIGKRINRGDFEIEVVSTVGLSVGQTVELYHQGAQNLEANMPGLTYNSIWNISDPGRGVRTLEKHIISKIEGNKVTFKNPVQFTITAEFTGAQLNRFETIEEVGVENILFTSDWLNYPEDYKHHANDIVDYGWRALKMTNVKNAWVRNCEFKDWNEMLQVSTSIGVTVDNIVCSGKKGHASYYAIYSYGVLFKDCKDIVDQGLSLDNVKGMGHGPGMRWSTTSTVFLNCGMQYDQSIDCHGYHPYGNLLDNVYGGCFRANGGNEDSYPNSGPYLTFWNFIHESRYSTVNFNFWDPINRKTHTYAYPNFIGFTAPGETVNLTNAGIVELQGQQAYPKSLFDAQLQLRLFGAYVSASSSKKDSEAILANDSQNETAWESGATGAGQWMMIDFGIFQNVSAITIKEKNESIGNWKLEYFNGIEWKELKTGSGIGAEKTISFTDVNTRKLRFKIETMLAGQEAATVSITEFKANNTVSNDADNDGVLNEFDLCTETSVGTKVDNTGCPIFSLPANNFTIESIGETCVEKNNGAIKITALETHNYVISIGGNDYEFSNNKILENLAPGQYDLCITVVGKNFKQCFQVEIEESTSITGKIEVEKDSANVSVSGGTAPYIVQKNGEIVKETYESNFSIQINDGDDLKIITNAACQGELSKHIDISESVRVYPNPTKGEFEIFVPGGLQSIDIDLYNVGYKRIFQKKYSVNGGVVKLDIEDKPNGIYFVKLNSKKSKKPVFVKIIKK